MSLSHDAKMQFVGTIQKLDDEALNELSKFIYNEKEHRARAKMLEFRVGDKVWFETTKYGKITGIVKKIGTKNISVQTSNFRSWRVYVGFLHKEGV